MSGLFSRLGRGFLATLNAYFVLIGLMTTIIALLVLFNFARYKDFLPLPSLLSTEGFVLVVRLEGALVERSLLRGSIINRFSKRQEITLQDMQRLQRLVLDDIRIEAVYLDIRSLRSDFTTLARLRQMLVAIVKSGKQVVAFMAQGDNSSFFLASACERIIVPPATSIDLPGHVFDMVYFGDALKRLGIGVQLLRSGERKLVFEQLQRNSPSEEAIEMYADLEADLRAQMVHAIAEGRKKNPLVVEQWLRRSVYTVAEAIEAGIIDAVKHPSSALAELLKTVGVEKRIIHEDYLRLAKKKKSPNNQTHGIGYVRAFGQIAMQGNNWENVLPTRLTEELHWMFTNDKVQAVVIRVDSPGGSALASELIWKEISNLSIEKPTVISMGSYAASGGYYIAMGGDYVFAEASTITGSIGVAGLSLNFADFAEKYGVSFHVFTQSERRDYYNLGTPMSENDRILINSSLQEVHDLFVDRVFAQRDLPMNKLKQLTDGRAFTGKQALALGLVDAVGSESDAFKKASELAGYATDAPYLVYRYPQQTTFWECLLATMSVRRCVSYFQDQSDIGARLRLLAKEKIVSYWLGALITRHF